MIYYVITVLIGAGAGLYAGKILTTWILKVKLGKSENEAQTIVEDAKRESDSILQQASLESKELILKAKSDIEKELASFNSTMREKEKRIARREEKLEQLEKELKDKQADANERLKVLERKEQSAEANFQKAQTALSDIKIELEKVAGMDQEQARKLLEEKVLEDARKNAMDRIRDVEKETQEKIDSIVKNIIVTAIQRYASEYVSERTVSVVQLPNDEMKGRIIGREGRNIRVFEAVSGVDVIIDDTPEAVILSCFNPMRREVGKMALTRLIADGRIHPTRIEEIVAKCEDELNLQCRKTGEQVAFDMGLQKLHPELLYLIGTLKFRSSYGQNLLAHSIEVGHLAGMLASELNIPAKYARRAGLLHDIGKAVDQQEEGSHAAVGALLIKKYGESGRIASAVAAHHNEIEPKSLLDHIVQIANTLSAQRPGARREFFASYIKRLLDLENLCMSFAGVKKAYAIQSGREIRVLLENNRSGDEGALLLAREIAGKIENNLAYPGQIKVSVIRETRSEDYAK
ncbi:ribonuclease Y [Myxococcota bacterium]|nr:ribonuclease Y [Myxococcota bacterium]MBU1380666.1 ribonuclease Y [Myxococcota bacterium]MBU1495874.1 ribonuclease Y [Myxococcota bacterium]